MAKRSTKTLSDTGLRAWLKAGKPLAKSDGDGLTFTLSAYGTAAWVLRYRHAGRRKELHLGRYPDMTLAHARAQAAEKRLEVTKGIDVALARQRSRAVSKNAWTVKELVRDYEGKVMPNLAASTLKCRTGQISELLARFRTYALAEVTHEDAHAWLESVASDRSYHAASNLRKAAAGVFRHAIARRKISTNPFIDVAMETVASKPQTRQRIKLDVSELHTFLTGLKAVNESDALTWRLMLVTGVRAGEMIGAEWGDIDLEGAQWCIPRAKIKTRRDMTDDTFVIPLPPTAVEWLRRLGALASGSRWVLPSRIGNTDKPADHERVLSRLKEYTAALKGCREIVLHDLRSTMRSHLTGSMNIRVEVAEKCINHKLAGLLGIYDKGDYLPERSTALRQWADYLESIAAGGNVVPLRKESRKRG